MEHSQHDDERGRQRVSAFMDDAMHDEAERHEALRELCLSPSARLAWLRYHQIGDALRSPDLVPLDDEEGFVERLAQRLRAQPVPLAPVQVRVAWRVQMARQAWSAVGAAVAGLAAVTLVCYSLPARRPQTLLATAHSVRAVPRRAVATPGQRVVAQWDRRDARHAVERVAHHVSASSTLGY